VLPEMAECVFNVHSQLYKRKVLSYLYLDVYASRIIFMFFFNFLKSIILD